MPHSVVKDILTQDPDGKRGKWIAVILEYDLEIKPTKLIKGQGLAKIMAESKFQALDINMFNALDEQEEFSTPIIEDHFLNSSWYANILYVLLNINVPPGLSKTKARFLMLKAISYYILDKCLYWKKSSGLLHKCSPENDANKIKHEFHEGECGGHLYWKSNANKILRASYYWPTLFQDVHKMIIFGHKCQIFEGKRKLLPLPLQAITVEAPFQ